jgi:hypothetical protein
MIIEKICSASFPLSFDFLFLSAKFMSSIRFQSHVDFLGFLLRLKLHKLSTFFINWTRGSLHQLQIFKPKAKLQMLHEIYIICWCFPDLFNALMKSWKNLANRCILRQAYRCVCWWWFAEMQVEDDANPKSSSFLKENFILTRRQKKVSLYFLKNN